MSDRLLLDSHIIVAISLKRLGSVYPRAAAALSDPGVKAYVSAAGLWEIAIKVRLGKLVLGGRLSDLPNLLTSLSLEVVQVNASQALADVTPEPPTRDPFDRMPLAQCQIDGLRLVTVDRALVDNPLAWRAA